MNDSGLVGRFQCFSDLPRCCQSFINRNGPLLDPISKRRPFSEFKDKRLLAFGLFKPMNRSDVRVVEAGEDLGFPLEPGEAIRI